jgi:hypothetical protein
MDNSSATPAPLTAHLNSASSTDTDDSYTPPTGIHLGRERVKWGPEVWERIDRAVNFEYRRTRVTSKFLPIHRVGPHVTTVPADSLLASVNGPAFSFASILASAALSPGSNNTPPLPNIDEAATTRLFEIWVEFALTPAQVMHENTFEADNPAQADTHAPSIRYSTAATLAARAANILSMAMDSFVLTGQIAATGPLVNSQLIGIRGAPTDYGLLSVGPANGTSVNNLTPNLPASQVVVVPSYTPTTFAQQTITISGALTGGGFTLSYDGNATGTINWSSATSGATSLVSQIQAALSALATPPPSLAVATGSLNNGVGTILVSSTSAATAITVASNNLTTTPAGGIANISVGTSIGPRYVENTVAGIMTAYSLLQGAGHNGPYAAAVPAYVLADSYSPLAGTLILPADRIWPVMTEGYLGSSALPAVTNPVGANSTAAAMPQIPNPTNPATQFMGLVVSTGGNTCDLVIGQEPVTAFSQLDQFGNHLLRVLTRFGLRIKDQTAMIRLEFQ